MLFKERADKKKLNEFNASHNQSQNKWAAIQIRNLFNSEEKDIAKSKKIYKDAIPFAVSNGDTLLADYLKEVIDPEEIMIDDETGLDPEKSENEKLSQLEKVYKRLSCAAVTANDLYVIQLLENKVNFTRALKKAIELVISGKIVDIEIVKFILSFPDTDTGCCLIEDEVDLQSTIIFEILDICHEYLGGGDNQISIEQFFKIANLLIQHPKININERSESVLMFSEDKDEEQYDLSANVRLTDTLIANIIAQRGWLAEALLQIKQVRTNIDNSEPYFYKRHAAYIRALHDAFTANPSEIGDQKSQEWILANAIQELFKIFLDLLRKPELLINAKDYYGACTALHMSVYCADNEATHALVLAGADITMPDGITENEQQGDYKIFTTSKWHFRDVYYDFTSSQIGATTYQMPKHLTVLHNQGQIKIKSENAKHRLPLQCALRLGHKWHTYYLLALHSDREIALLFSRDENLESLITKVFPGALEWAKGIKKEAAQFAKELVTATMVCKSADTGILPFSNEQGQLYFLPHEVCIHILSFALSNNIIPHWRILQLLIDVPKTMSELQGMFQENKLINQEVFDNNDNRFRIDHISPSIERQCYIEFVKEQTDRKIYEENIILENVQSLQQIKM